MDYTMLPQKFLEDMKRILGEEFPDFAASYSKDVRKGLRLNTLKIRPEEFMQASGFHLTPVPWTVDGYFYSEEDQPSRHTFYSAGLYYLQEPSAMAPAQLLPVAPGDRVLDLCAAPGGKTTELGARLQGQGLLVANEISPVRVKALVRNAGLFGIPNAIITNTSPAKLLERYPRYFDKVLVDAPCSGEGMFRKDEDAIRTWSPEKVEECAATQREIIVEAADMLQSGGHMVYSTCTFAPEENEMTVLHLLKMRPEMELVEITKEDGREGFAPGLSVDRLRELGYLTRTAATPVPATPVPGTDTPTASRPVPGTDTSAASNPGPVPGTDISAASNSGPVPGTDTSAAPNPGPVPGTDPCPDLTKTARLWPHRIEGEGHFVAMLRKKPGLSANPGADSFAPIAEDFSGAPIKKNRKKSKNRNQPEAAGQKKMTADEKKRIRDFIEPYLQGKELRDDQLDVHDGKVYYMAPGVTIERGIKAVRAGVYLGELKKDRFEPEQELALILPAAPAENAGHSFMPGTAAKAEAAPEKTCRLQNIPEDYLNLYVCLSPSDDRLEQYLHGATVPVRQAGPNGWRLLCSDIFPVGWGKLVNGQLKNKYPLGWRIPG